MKTEDFSETIAASDLKVGRSRHFISSPVQSTGRAIVVTLASAFALALAFPSRHF